jgi:hypothetical protein
VINTVLCGLTLIAAGALSLIDCYAGAAFPLAVLSLVFLIEATLRHTMLQVAQDWKRYRYLERGRCVDHRPQSCSLF